MGRRILAFDCDGVVIDFAGHFLPFANGELGTSLSYEDCHCHDLARSFGVSNEAMDKVHEKWHQLYSHDVLQPVDEALESLELLSARYRNIIITSRRPHLEAVTRERFTQCPQVSGVYFALGRNNPFAGGDGRLHKPDLAEQLGALAMIEDSEEEFIHWSSDKVEPICFAHPWNECLIETHPHIPRLNWPQIVERFLG